LVGKLDSQEAGKVHRGRKLSDAGVTARFFHEVSEAHLKRIIKIDLHADLFTYDIDQAALARAQAMDGKLLLVTNVADLTPKEVVRRYKALADIERGFRVLKSEIEIAPVFHRLPDRIKAHASICMLALILYRVMRQRLKMSGSDLSPEAALADSAAHSAPQCEYQQRRAHCGYFNHRPTPDGCAGRTEDQETLTRRPIEPVVVAAQRLALYRSTA
jgi:hypothetical protein